MTLLSLEVSRQLMLLLQSTNAHSVVDFIVGPRCGLENLHETFYNSTSIVLAAWMGRLDVVQLLLSEYSPDTNAANSIGMTALHYTATRSHRNLKMVRCLVEGGAVVDAVDDKGRTPLYLAVCDCSITMTSLFLELGANPNIAAYASENQDTPLHLASGTGQLDLARTLLANGGYANAVNGKGKTPIDLAVENGHVDLILLLKGEGGIPP